MKGLSVLVMVVVVFVTASVLLIILVAPVQAQVADQPSCSITMTQLFNHVTFEVTWSGGSQDGTYPFQFGDLSLPDVLTGASGSKNLPHDYAWNVDGVATYTAEVTVVGDGGQCSCEQQVVIDDRPVAPASFAVYLPLAFSAPPSPPTVEMSRQPSEVVNHVVIHLTWSEANEAWHRLDWGDNSFVDLFGSRGDKVVDHWYPSGAYTATFVVTGPGGTTQRQLTLSVES